MQGTGTSYAVSGETTEWEDILIKKGIKTKEEVYLEKGLNPADVSTLFLDKIILHLFPFFLFVLYLKINLPVCISLYLPI
jgi:hypothetical protein